MNNTISVPRDLLLEVRDSVNEAGNLSYRQHHIDHHRRLTRKLDELIAAPAAEVEGLEVVAWSTFDGEGGYDLRLYENNEDYREGWVARNGTRYLEWVEPLCSLPKAQAVIEQYKQDALAKDVAAKAMVEVLEESIDYLSDNNLSSIHFGSKLFVQMWNAVDAYRAVMGEKHE